MQAVSKVWASAWCRRRHATCRRAASLLPARRAHLRHGKHLQERPVSGTTATARGRVGCTRCSASRARRAQLVRVENPGMGGSCCPTAHEPIHHATLARRRRTTWKTNIVQAWYTRSQTVMLDLEHLVGLRRAEPRMTSAASRRAYARCCPRPGISTSAGSPPRTGCRTTWSSRWTSTCVLGQNRPPVMSDLCIKFTEPASVLLWLPWLLSLTQPATLQRKCRPVQGCSVEPKNGNKFFNWHVTEGIGYA